MVVSDHAPCKDREITCSFILLSHHVWFGHRVMVNETLAPSSSRGNSQQFMYCKLLWIKSELPCTCICLHCSDYKVLYCRPDTIILKCTVNINNPYSTPHPTQTHQRIQADWRQGVFFVECKNPHRTKASVAINRPKKCHTFQNGESYSFSSWWRCTYDSIINVSTLMYLQVKRDQPS